MLSITNSMKSSCQPMPEVYNPVLGESTCPSERQIISCSLFHISPKLHIVNVLLHHSLRSSGKSICASLYFFHGPERAVFTVMCLNALFGFSFCHMHGLAIKAVSVSVPTGNRWHLQMRIIPGEFIYKGTVCKRKLGECNSMAWEL